MKESTLVKNQQRSRWGVIAGAFTVVILLEFSTSPAYVFGYLYTGPILIVSRVANASATFRVTLAACILTIMNLWISKFEPINPAIVGNRLIAVIALIVTGWLSDRNRRNEQTLAQQQAQIAAQEKLASIRDDFVSTLTHDLKTPLFGAIETLKSFETGKFGAVTPTQQKVLAMITRSHKTTLQLVETLLDVYRNDISGLELHLAPVDLATLATEAIATLSDLAAARRVYINLNYGESDFRRAAWVNGDALQLYRVFINLLTNAINHSPRGGKVEVLLETHELHHLIKILDKGPGITPSELPHLFEKFYQGYSDRQAKGSGLGLYLSRQIIVAHGGTIWAENHAAGGALFGFRLTACPPGTNYE